MHALLCDDATFMGEYFYINAFGKIGIQLMITHVGIIQFRPMDNLDISPLTAQLPWGMINRRRSRVGKGVGHLDHV